MPPPRGLCSAGGSRPRPPHLLAGCLECMRMCGVFPSSPPWMTSSAGHRTSSWCPSCLSNSVSPKRIESPRRSMSWCDTPSISRPNRKLRRPQITLYPLLSRQSQSPGLARQPPLSTPLPLPQAGVYCSLLGLP